MTKEFYSYEKFREDISNSIPILEKENFDAIIGISRGGLTFSHFLAENLDIRRVYSVGTISYNETEKLDDLQLYGIPNFQNEKKILVADDIADSGRTLQKISQHLSKFSEINFQTATIFYKESSVFQPNFFFHKTENWIEFFWNPN
ncbi:putative phosphoribosyltransferase [Thiovulum sp. ES]|nr:putative phosphoribosyltransferase [Thiovulum sp. ES]